MKRIALLGVPIDPVTEAEAVERIRSMLASEAWHHVMTPNSEMLVEANGNPVFRSILQQSSLNIPDSAGLLWAARWTGQHLPARVTGVDTVMALCADLPSDHPVFLLGAREGVAEKAAAVLRRTNPHLAIAGTYSGSPRGEEAPSIIDRINASGAHLLLVAFGAPVQDIWIHTHLSQMPAVRVAMGVGGTFDFLAGTKKRAPRIMQKIHCEWLWRLMLEPSRIGRIYRAVIVFPWLVVRSRKEGGH